MKHNYLLPVIFLFISSHLFAQKVTAEDKYTKYFKLPREALFIHLNKTTYVSGEEIWFKGYTYDRKNHLSSKATTNINIGLYDANGKQLKKGLFQAENGFTKGNFLVDSTLTSGTYYIKADTNWMKNFKEDDSYVQKINIIASNDPLKKAEKSQTDYDFQFLPEGGHIVANTKNNIGFKVLDKNGASIQAVGTIYDDSNTEIATFKSNAFGLGTFLLEPDSQKVYTAKINLANGETITKSLPKIESKGISVIVNNIFPNKVILNFNTNSETSTRNKTYKLLIHQNGKLKTVAFTFDDKNEKSIVLTKDKLYKGVNTITLFDESNNPLLERMFFNDYGIKSTAISVAKLNTVQDSIVLSAQQTQASGNANLSISILPETTESYNPNHTIISAFYLKPYLKGTVENPQYYFHKMDRKKKYELDILLLTQGWSKYDWDAIFGNPPNQLYPFQNGITIKGTVNFPAAVDRLFLYATEYHASQFITLDEKQQFNISNIYLKEGEAVRFSYVDKKGVFKKPKMYVSFIISKGDDTLDTSNLIFPVASKNAESANFTVPESFVYDTTEELNAVVIEAEKIKKEELDPIVINGTLTKVTLKEYHQFPFVTDYIRYKGYNVTQNFGSVQIETRTNHTFAGNGKIAPLVFLDDAPLANLNILYNYSMANVEKILIDRTGSGYGSRSAGGIIKIYTRVTPLLADDASTNTVYSSNVAPVAFQKPKKYYAPKYSSYLSDAFEKFGVISWVPNVNLKNNEASTVKIFNTNTKHITLFIEGITDSGALISQKKTIQVR